MWRVHGVWWLQDTKLIFPFFLVALSGGFYENAFFHFFNGESALVMGGVSWPCHGRKTRSGPSGAHRGNQRRVWLHRASVNSHLCFFLSRFMWPCYRLSRQNAVFERFLGRSRSHRSLGIHTFETQTKHVHETPNMRWNRRGSAYAVPARTRQKKWNLRFMR